MPFRRQLLVERDLNAANTWAALNLIEQRRRRVAVTDAIRTEQHHTITAPTVGVGEIPYAALIKPHNGFDPPGAVKVRPLVGEAQMHLNEGSADGFEIEHAGVVGKMSSHPGAAAPLDLGVRLGMHD